MQRRPVIPPNPFPLHREPGRKALRAHTPHLFREPVLAHPTPVRDLILVDAHLAGASPNEYRAQLMLRPDAVELRLILELEQEMQRALESKLLIQPPVDGHLHALGPPRMAAATVRPIMRPQPFRRRATLQQQLAAVIENEQRECSVQHTLPIMATRLAQVPDLAVRL